MQYTLRLLCGENVPAPLVRALRKQGFDAQTAGDVGLLGLPDDQILAFAQREKRLRLTLDKDFFPRAGKETRRTGIILTRYHRPTPAKLAERIPPVLRRIARKLADNTTIITDDEIRIHHE